MTWNGESEESVPMTALGAETRRVSDELLARAADERRTLVLFAVALAVAVLCFVDRLQKLRKVGGLINRP